MSETVNGVNPFVEVDPSAELARSAPDNGTDELADPAEITNPTEATDQTKSENQTTNDYAEPDAIPDPNESTPWLDYSRSVE
jgi:hypothetical protein